MLLHVRQNVRVNLQRHRDLRVTEPFADDVHRERERMCERVRPLFEQEYAVRLREAATAAAELDKQLRRLVEVEVTARRFKAPTESGCGVTKYALAHAAEGGVAAPILATVRNIREQFDRAAIGCPSNRL